MENEKTKQKRKEECIFKIIPKYSIIPIFACILTLSSSYYGAATFINLLKFKKKNVIGVIDNWIPIVPFFLIPYVFFYFYTVLGPAFIARIDKKVFVRHISAWIIGSLIGFVSFVLFPTWVVVEGFNPHSFWEMIVKNIFHEYDVHANACPSFHCFVSWLIFLGVKELNIQDKYKIKFFIVSLSICISTVFLKRHGLIDIPGGILLAEIAWRLAKKQRVYDFFNKMFKIDIENKEGEKKIDENINKKG